MEGDSLIAGRYRLEREIARGGQACVYLAEHVGLKRKVALKVLTPPRSAEGNELRVFEERFQLEARTLAALSHPHIVTIHDFGPFDGSRYFIAMEYIDGERFNTLCEGPMPPARVLRLILQVCDALRYAHRSGVVHRDIKHSNVLVQRVDGQEQVKVVDFGIAKLLEGSEDVSLTSTGMVLGSPQFMAPELVRGLPVDHRIDIYAIGILMYCALAGKYPFSASNARGIIIEHLTREPPAFRERAPETRIAPALEAIVRRCLAKEPEQRYASVDELIEALRAYQAEATQPTATLQTPAARRRSALPLVLAGLAAVAMLAVAVVSGGALYFLAQQYAPAPPAAAAATTTAASTAGTSTAAARPTAPPDPAPAPSPIPAPAATETVAPAASASASAAEASRPASRPATPTAPAAAAAPTPTPAARPDPAPDPAPAPTAAEPAARPGFSIDERDIRDPWED